MGAWSGKDPEVIPHMVQGLHSLPPQAVGGRESKVGGKEDIGEGVERDFAGVGGEATGLVGLEFELGTLVPCLFEGGTGEVVVGGPEIVDVEGGFRDG